MAKKDYYAILGVEPGASPDRIRSAYRARAKEQHPDLAGHDSTPGFQEVAEAYAVLSDLGRRARYDRERANPSGEPWPAAEPLRRPHAHRWQPPRHARRAGGDDHDAVREPLRPDAFSQDEWGTRSGPGSLRPEPLASFGWGAEAPPEPLRQDRIRGTGPAPPEPLRAPTPRPPGPLPAVRMTREGAEITVSPAQAARGATVELALDVVRACPRCAGRGHRLGWVCELCGGRCQVAQMARLEVRIPPGVGPGPLATLPPRAPGEPPRILRLVIRASP